MRRRDWLRLVGCGLSLPAVAQGVGVRAIAVGDLLAASTAVCVGTPVFVRSEWVEVFGQRRIVSAWRMRVERVLFGDPRSSLEFMTLGGTVGDVQQWVPHEAKIVIHRPHLVFLMPGPRNCSWVTGMQQGAYALQSIENEASIVLTSEQAEVAQRAGSACWRLAGCSINDVEQLLSVLVKS